MELDTLSPKKNTRVMNHTNNFGAVTHIVVDMQFNLLLVQPLSKILVYIKQDSTIPVVYNVCFSGIKISAGCTYIGRDRWRQRSIHII